MIKINTIKYVLLQCFFWMAHCVISGNFANIYLCDKEYSNTEIGIVLTGGVLLAVVLQLILSSLCDRHDARMPVFICLTVIILTVVLTVIMVLSDGYKIPVIIIFICIIALQYVIPVMMNTIALNIIKSGIKINYGLGRGAGSVAFAAVSFSLGRIITVNGSGNIMYIFIGLNIGMLAAVLMLYPKKEMLDKIKERSDEKNDENSNFLDVARKHKRYMVFLAGIMLIFICVAFVNSYLTNVCNELGSNSDSVGIALAIAAIVELPAMALYNRISNKISCVKVLRIASIAFVIKIFILAIAGNIALVYVSMLFQMFSYALYVPASVFYTDKIMGQEDKTKGQALLSIAGGGLGLGGILGGIIIDAFGIRILFIAGTVITAAGALLVNIAMKSEEAIKKM